MSKQKTGILTFHKAINFGAVLQAYALKTVCDGLGYETHIVDYFPAGTAGTEAIKPSIKARVKNLKKTARKLASLPWDRKREKAYAEFRARYLNESANCGTADDIRALGYDVLIAGSDQIWNYKITRGSFDPVYFANIDPNARQIVYAASAQDTPFPLDKELELGKMLEQSPAAISIREKKLADYVAEVTGKEYDVVLDPTLIADKKDLDAICAPNRTKKPYILIYQIDRNPNSDISVKTLRKRFCMDAYTMTTPRIGSIRSHLGACGPEDFIAYIKNAEFIVTNSFHGLALSLIYGKNFYVYENGGVMSRIDGLLEQLGLLNRKVRKVEDIDLSNKVDYSEVNVKLSALKNSSLNFLGNALNGRCEGPRKAEPKVKNTLPLNERAKSDCCGCSACADLCPVGAISMKPDEEGFLYPQVDSEACLHCGMCDRVCGFYSDSNREARFELPLAYGVKHKDFDIRNTSRSGAAFVAFSDTVLNEGGTVYGAVLNDDLTVSHIRAASGSERDRMKTAKYVQSNTCGIYPMVASDLAAGRKVLFSGTPCQTEGLLTMLKERGVNTDGLVCCDLVCHGVPSPMVWKDYTAYIEKKYHGRIMEAQFRDKSFGWDTHFESFVLQGRKKKIVSRDYTDLFYAHLMFRPSCYNCQFANVKRHGDLTLADFWGIEKNSPEFDDNHGVSLVLVNTEKGRRAFEKAKPYFDCFECDIRNCMQPTLYKASEASCARSDFWADYDPEKMDALIKKYTVPKSTVGKAKRLVKRSMYAVGIRKHP